MKSSSSSEVVEEVRSGISVTTRKAEEVKLSFRG